MCIRDSPNGISPEGKARRLEHLISLALKFGTTDFIMPHPDQNIPWKIDQHGYNLTPVSYTHLIAQFLLGLKAQAAATEALAAIKNGEKPVITVANTCLLYTSRCV